MSRRWQIARALGAMGITRGLLALRSRTSPWLPILTYHRVHPNPDACPFDEGVIDSTPAEFDAQMAILAKHFHPVGIDGLIGWANGEPLPPNSVAVTFDDGYLDNYEHALPILQKHGIRAIFFIATHYLEERRLFWWDKIAYLVKNSKVLPPTALRAKLRAVKDTFGLDLDAFFAQLIDESKVPWSNAREFELADEELMTWDQVRALRQAGMDVQSHTRTHRVLHTLPTEKLKDELEGSRLDLEKVLGEPIRAVSYPIGKPIHERPALRQAVRDAGYVIGFSNATGTNSKLSKIDRFDVKRLGMDRGLPDSYFRGMLALPWLAA